VTLAALITSCRILGNDSTDSNLITVESPIGLKNAVNTKYRLQNQNIVSGSVYVSFATTFRTQTGFTVDLTNGILSFSVAPASGADLLADYYFQWFTDTAWTEFLNNAALQLGGSNDPTMVPAGLVMALQQYALYYYFLRRATQYANKYASTGGQAGQSVETVTGNFQKLASTAMKTGNQLRDDYYLKQGKQKDPSASVVSMQFDPMTPRR
jgi:hypothetical protein